MNWFLYDNGLRHERVKSITGKPRTLFIIASATYRGSSSHELRTAVLKNFLMINTGGKARCKRVAVLLKEHFVMG